MPELEFEVVSNRIEDDMWVFDELGNLVNIGPVAIGEVCMAGDKSGTVYYECISNISYAEEPQIREHYLAMALVAAKRRAIRAQSVPE
jgi:hypothetical protein